MGVKVSHIQIKGTTFSRDWMANNLLVWVLCRHNRVKLFFSSLLEENGWVSHLMLGYQACCTTVRTSYRSLRTCRLVCDHLFVWEWLFAVLAQHQASCTLVVQMISHVSTTDHGAATVGTRPFSMLTHLLVVLKSRKNEEKKETDFNNLISRASKIPLKVPPKANSVFLSFIQVK